jgi:N6-L-threonylcarbamoyladenine synthase
MLILGIETSCDETAASVVADGRTVLSSVVASQTAIHHPYGGVVPELASRKHLEAIRYVTETALHQADVSKKQLDGVAVTQGPGLIGALLVGFCFSRAFAYTLNIPWIGVSHLDGHINSVFLEPQPPPFPFVALLASGGHTSIYYVSDYLKTELMGQTRDDAAGEAFDKVAKMLGLGYPGGGVIGKYAQLGDPHKIAFPRPYLDKNNFDFSFSGLKSAVNRYIQGHKDIDEQHIADIAAGFQEAVADVLAYKIINAAKQKACRHIAIVGGVAANRHLREKVAQDASDEEINVYIPSLKLCGDNAAMIASTGWHYLKAGKVTSPDADVYSRLRI